MLGAVSVVYAASIVGHATEGTFSSIAVFIVIYTAGAFGRRPVAHWARAACVVLMAALVAWSVAEDQIYGDIDGPDRQAVQLFVVLLNVFYFVAAWVMGELAHSRRRREELLKAQAGELADAHAEIARRAVGAERMRIARELHDVVAHHVSVMGVQAGAARRVLGRSPEQTAGALASIETSSREAVSELHDLLGFLRQEGEADTTAPLPTLEHLDDLVGQITEVGDRILVKEDASDTLVAVLDQAARTARVSRGVDDGTIDAEVAERLASPRVLRVEALDPTDQAERSRQAMATFGIFLLLFQVFAFGFAIAGGIVEEKSSRVVEVLLAKVRPGELLAGKIVGIWVLTTVQTLALVIVGLIGATASGSLDLPPGWFGVVATLFGWYVVLYLFYACVFAICGALAASPEEMQSTSTPATILLMVGYGAAIASLNDPDSTVAVVASFFPSSAPLVMPLRSATGSVATWEVLVSVAVTLGVGALLVPVAGRIYRGSVLQTRQTKLGAAWRSARS